MSLPNGLRFDILRRDGFRCRYCGKTGAEAVLEVDHVHPRSDGGSDHPSNLITACWACNSGKSNKHVPPLDSPVWQTLVGKFFLTFDPPGSLNAQHQGVILSDLGNGYFLAEYGQWLTGGPAWYGRRLIHIRTITEEGWSLFADAEELRDSYEYGGARGVGERVAAAQVAAGRTWWDRLEDWWLSVRYPQRVEE